MVELQAEGQTEATKSGGKESARLPTSMFLREGTRWPLEVTWLAGAHHRPGLVQHSSGSKQGDPLAAVCQSVPLSEQPAHLCLNKP